jgi:hypothetical protein
MCLGFLTGTFMIATVFTAWDIYKNTHLILGIIYTTFWVIMTLLIAIAILNNKSFPISYAIILIVYFIVALINLLIVTILRYEPINETNLIVQATIQKLTVYFSLICFLILGLKALELEKKKEILNSAS